MRTRSRNFASKAIRNGYRCDCLKRLFPLRKIFDQEDWGYLLKESINSSAEYYASINNELNKEFGIRYRDEQRYKSTEYYEDILKSNYNRIVGLIEVDSSLLERHIGIDRDSVVANGRIIKTGLSNCRAGNSKVLVTLLHSKDPIGDIGFGTFMNLIRKGDLHPNQFEAIYDYSYVGQGRNRKIDSKFKYGDMDIRFLKLSYGLSEAQTDLEQVNGNRKFFGLCSIQTVEELKKVGLKYKIAYRFGYK